MVPWNFTDTQMALHERVLRTALEQALPAVPPLLPTLETFGNALPRAINTAVRNYLRHSEPRPPDGPRPGRTRLLDTEGAPEPPDHYLRHPRGADGAP